MEGEDTGFSHLLQQSMPSGSTISWQTLLVPPFIAKDRDAQEMSSSEVGYKLDQRGSTSFFPHCSAMVGSDFFFVGYIFLSKKQTKQNSQVEA